MKPTRRDLLAWSGGAFAGMLFTPVPWKVLSDVSIWTQNWPWIPQPAHGPVDVKLTSCTLCPNACGLRVRMAAGAPVGLAGVAQHPVSRGALCPLAYGAHQLNWHPARLREVRHRGRKASWEEATAAFRRALADGPVGIIDGRPGRAASTLFSRFVAAHAGRYGVARCPEERALAPYERWTGVSVSALGYDLENARTIVSFGAPLLDGWGTPGRFTRLWSERAAGTADPDLRVIQVEPEQSRTAAFAWRWIRVRPGSESAMAAAIARVLIEERLVSAFGPTPPDSADQTGLAPDAIRDLARTLVERTPTVAIAAGDNESVAALNVLLGAVGARGGIVRRNGADPEVYPEPSGPARAVLIDSTVPWNFTPNFKTEVFRFAAWYGDDAAADWLLPAPGFLEELTDVPTPPGSAIETYAVAAPLVIPPPGVKSAAQFLGEIDSGIGSVDDVIQERSADLQTDLLAGAVWAGDTPNPGRLHCELREWPRSKTAQARAPWTGGWTLPVLPPLAAKLYQESALREAPVTTNL